MNKSLLIIAVLLLSHSTLALAFSVNIQPVSLGQQNEAWLVEDHALPVVHLSFTFTRAGSAYAPEGKNALPGLVLDMLMRGAGKYPQIAFEEQLANHAIELDYRLDRDDIHITITVLKEHLATAIELLTLALTQPRLDENTLATTKQETIAYLQKKQESPGTVAQEALYKKLFSHHTYGHSSADEIASIHDLSTLDIRAFMQRHISRNQLLIGASGALSSHELTTMLTPLLAALPATEPVTELPNTPAFPETTNITNHMEIAQSTVLFALPGLGYTHTDFYPLMIANHILGGGSFSARLMQDLREENGWVYHTSSYLNPLDRTALWQGSAATKPESTDHVIDAIRNHISTLAQDGITADELRHAKKAITRSFSNRFDALSPMASYLTFIQREALGIDFFSNRNARIEAITRKQVNDALKTYLQPQKLVFSVTRPKKTSTDNHQPL